MSNCIHAWFIHMVLWIRSTELTCSACSRAILFSFSSTRLILLGDPLSILQSNQGVNPISGLAIASSPHLEVKVQIKSGRLITLRTPHFHLLPLQDRMMNTCGKQSPGANLCNRPPSIKIGIIMKAVHRGLTMIRTCQLYAM